MTTQLNNMLALLGNFDHAAKATETAMDSAGSAAKENEAYMGGLEAKTTALKASFQKLSTEVVNSNLVKGILDIGIAIMDGLTSPAGAAVAQVTLLSGALIGLVGMAKAGGLLDIIKNLSGFGAGAGGGEAGAKALTGIPKILASIPPQIWAIIAVGAVAVGITNKLTTSYAEATAEVEKLKQENEELYGVASKYADLKAKEGTLNAQQKQELDYLEKRKELQEQEIRDAEKLQFDIWQREYLMPTTTPSDWYGDPFKQGGAIVADEEFSNFAESIQQIGDEFKSTEDFINGYNGKLGETLNEQTEYIDQLKHWKDMGFELDEAQEKQISLFDELLSLYSNDNLSTVEKFAVALYDSYVAQGMSADEAMAKADEAASKFEEDMTDISDATEDASNDVEVNVEAPGADKTLEQLQKLEEATAKTYPGISIPVSIGGVDVGGTMSTLLPNIFSNATGTTNAPGGPTLVNELGPELISAKGKAYIAGGGKPTITNLPKGAVVLPANVTEEAMSSKSKISSSIPAYSNGTGKVLTRQDGRIIKNNASYGVYESARPNAGSITATALGKQSGWIDPVTGLTQEQLRRMGALTGGILTGKLSGEGSYIAPPTPGPKGPGGPKPVDIKAQSKLFEDQIKLLKEKLDLMEKEGATEEERIEQIKKIQAEIEKQKQWYYAHGLDDNSEYIKKLHNQWLDYDKELKKLYEDQAGYYDMLFGAVADKTQDEIDELEEKKQKIQEQNNEIQKQIELEKALDELAKAKQRKKLVFKDGKMQYVQDVDAVSAAQARVDEIKNRERQDAEIEAIDKQIAELEKYKEAWDSVVGDFDKKQDLLLLKEKFGVDFEASNWREKLKNLQDYINEYNDLMVKAGYKESDLKARPTSITGMAGAVDGVSATSLWSMGVPTPSAMMNGASAALSSLSKNTSITIQNFNPNLPGVTDGEGFVNYLRNNFLQQTLQFAK